MSTLRAIGAAAAILAAASLMAARSGMAAEADKMERVISVSATGSVAVEPDMAHVTAGVATDADTAKDAIARNSAAMAKVVDGLKRAGIAAGDIQTSQLSVQPRYAPPKDGRPGTIVGYNVVNQVRIAVRDIKRLGELLDQVIGLGANQMGGISFDVADAERVKDEARKQAMANARRRAELYAAAAGVQLGHVLRISESVGEMRPMGAARMTMAAPVPIEAGTQMLSVEVHVTYAVR
jgi:uncharacterized protein YggE